MTETTTPRTRAYRDSTGHDHHVSGGAQHQDGLLKLMVCNTCQAEVVWATSSRTGRKYLVDVFTGQSGARYYVKAQSHDCSRRTVGAVSTETLEERVARIRAEVMAELAAEEG